MAIRWIEASVSRNSPGRLGGRRGPGRVRWTGRKPARGWAASAPRLFLAWAGIAIAWPPLAPAASAQVPSLAGSGREAAVPRVPRDRRPRVALVLSGGGARGIAHLGVLRVLEELRVPIDFIAGTSMGAVIGGLYASGVPLRELERQVREADWGVLFGGDAPRERLVYRRKQDDIRFPVRAEVGFRNGRFRLPRGLVSGQRLQLLVERLALSAAEIDDFDRLPIPFRALATDIETGAAVAIGSGSLSRAVLASMAVPGLFAPVSLDGRLLVDGGVVRNLPVDVALAREPDMVIAVDVMSPLDSAATLTTALDISRQIVKVPVRLGSESQAGLLSDRPHVLVVPSMPGIDAAAFSRVEEALAAGTMAARSHAEELREFALPPGEYERWAGSRGALDREPPRIDRYAFDNRSRLSTEALRRMLHLSGDGSPLDVDHLIEDLETIHGLGWFETVGFGIRREGGERVLRVSVVPEPWGPNYLRFGLGFEDDLGGNSAFDLLLSYTLSQLNGLGGELRNELQIGGTRRLFSEIYQPLSGSSVAFVAPSLEWTRSLADVLVDGQRVAEYRRTDLVARTAVGARLGSWGEARVGGFWGRVDVEARTGLLEAPVSGEGVGGTEASIAVDRLDDRSFPRSGDALELRATWWADGTTASGSYAVLRAEGLRAVTRGATTLLVSGSIASSLSTDPPFYDRPALGGFRRLSGLRPRELTARHAAFGSVAAHRGLTTLPTNVGGGRLLLTGAIELGHVWDPSPGSGDTRIGGRVGLGLETVLGPLNLAYGRADRGRDAWFLSLGRTF